jgi:serine/threonine protein kinase
MDKLYSELKISSQLDHPNIVKCFETFTTQEKWYIVNEYCNYGTFRNLVESLREIKELDKREELSFYYLTQLRNALYYLHKKNIIHRDLKPENILMTKSEDDEIVVKLADFGFSRYFQNNEDNKTGYDDLIGTICGSPLYMAPELLVDLRYNLKADLWSFGIIMYELLNGKIPYPNCINSAQLIEFIKKKNIKYECIFSDNCMNLMKYLLKQNPEDRINWDDFFNHDWFRVSYQNKDIVESSISICVKNSQPINIPKPIKKEQEQDSVKLIENYICSSAGSNTVNIELKKDNEYVIVDSSKKQQEIKIYKESIGSSVIRIVSKSMDFFTAKSF